LEIPYYRSYISEPMLRHLTAKAKPVAGVKDLTHTGKPAGLETPNALNFLCDLYDSIKPQLNAVLNQRTIDREFIDERTRSTRGLNETILGQQDARGRIVAGPLSGKYCMGTEGKDIATLPEYLRGIHVTLFGPPDDAKLAVNAMNAFHRRINDEPPVVEELLSASATSPKWGADDEDSKTPLHRDLVDAGVHLTACFNGDISFTDQKTNKSYSLEKDRLSLPIKRFPGLALPCSFLFLRGSPVPLHLYDFALHLFANWKRPEALSFYVPKLENEEEAAYIGAMVEAAEGLIGKLHPEYKAGTVRLFIVLENPRAIFRVHEIMDALHPYFAGASLGWHDYLASTARLFKEDPNYRIPVKADPNIVIKYIKGSHDLLTAVVGSRGGVKIGGMYGVLPLDTDPKSESFQITMLGFIKDVITQMKRGLSGFWVAHPDFVRLGLALVEAWRLHTAKEPRKLEQLVTALLDERHHEEILKFVRGSDIIGLDISDPNYPRSLIVADIKQSEVIANNHPDEIRYNVFQSLQYLADWLCGNGCVALPAEIDGVAVRVMDDLATCERSRWEVWHEIYHDRFGLDEFLKIVHEEMLFIRKDLSNAKKIVQVKWNERTAKWYPVAMNLMVRLMADHKPAEFATELLMAFTDESVRQAADPWAEARKLDPEKFHMPPYIERFNYFFGVCGSRQFARAMAEQVSYDAAAAEQHVMSFSPQDVKDAAHFHGDIGEDKKTLDHTAAQEQAMVMKDSDGLRAQLRELGQQYRKKFGFKFLVSAKGKDGKELLAALTARLENRPQQELDNARRELWEISRKRLIDYRDGDLRAKLEQALKKHKVAAASIHVTTGRNRGQNLCFNATESTWFEVASLSKPLAAAMALEYFKNKKIALNTPVNELLKKSGSKFRLTSDAVLVEHLLNHTALGMHYVKGVPVSREYPKADGYLKDIEVLGEPGKKFHYSGGGFLVLEHLLESLEKKSIHEISAPFLDKMNLVNLTFEQRTRADTHYATGESRLMFPALAAGAMGNARDVSRFLGFMTQAFHRLGGAGPISHDTAIRMMRGVDRGSGAFMGAKMGLGLFTVEAGANRFMVHQGANDGFRALFVHGFEGPDCDKGFTILCTGDFNGVQFIAEAAALILHELKITGVDTARLRQDFDPKGVPPEAVVNQAFKHMIFNAFQPDLPEAVTSKGPRDPWAERNLAVDGIILEVSNQGFARAENLLSPHLPTFDPALFGRQGKVMDSWETVRHNPNGQDTLRFRMKKPSSIAQVSVSTQFHLGNQAEEVKLEGMDAKGKWKEILPLTPLEGHAIAFFDSADAKTVFSDIRVTMVPDGGLTRLGLYAEPVDETTRKFKEPIPQTKKPMVPVYPTGEDVVKRNWNSLAPDTEVDVASLAYGGKILRASNEHFAPAAQVISPYAPIHMFDGFETARSREKNHFEDVEIELGTPSRLHRLELDFTYFRNNNPREVQIEGFDGENWLPLLPRTAVKPYAGSIFSAPVEATEDIVKIKVTVFPDGGVNRIRAFTRI